MRSFAVSQVELSTSRVIAAKMELLGDGGSSYYLRKGEAQGAIEVATYAMRLVQQAMQSGLELAPWLADAVDIAGKIAAGAGVAGGTLIGLNKMWGIGLRQLEKFLRNMEKTSELSRRLRDRLRAAGNLRGRLSSPIARDIRVICNPSPANLQALPLLLAIGARVRHRPRQVATGTHRYYVNDRRSVIHVKVGDNRYLSIESTDPRLRNLLKRDFLREWRLCGPDIRP